MENPFSDHPVLNSPYEIPDQHWEFDDSGQPTQQVLHHRRTADFITPIPKPKKKKSAKGQSTQARQTSMDFTGLGDDYDPTSRIGQVRTALATWRALDRSQWQVTPQTADLLQYWRSHKFSSIRPFFCQIEAVETAIWLTEVAPKSTNGRKLLDYLENANREANPDLLRIALKMATGSGKTTVMAMIIAWQTINAVRHHGSAKFTRGFLITTPGITIKDRLRVLQPNDPDSYFKSRELVPQEYLPDIQKAIVVITNYHAFKHRERLSISAGGRRLLQGRTGTSIKTTESEGQMVQRVMPELMGIKGVMALNDEGHHCYRERVEKDDAPLTGDEKETAERDNEAARLWINGLETVKRKIGIKHVIDLSATPFFLKGSGYAEGTLFPWTMSDFSLMDSIECGIVKLPRVPVSDNIPGSEMPVYREIWEHIRDQMPRKGRRKGVINDPESLPLLLQTAIEALYGHYKAVYEEWEKFNIKIPPCMIIVCNNTAVSKLVYDYVSGYEHDLGDGSFLPIPGKLELFRNYSEHGQKLPKSNTLLIDSTQLESGDELDKNFHTMAADEIERFRRELIERGDIATAENMTDQALLREVMNTVGKEGRLGEQVRCVVSVSMLTEGWDANNVTHIMGVRAFGTQLLCEQVVGRALRRQSYDLNGEGLLDVEYADILGIPFDFTAEPVVAKPRPPRQHIHVRAMRPERDHLEIRFPNVRGYRVEPGIEKLKATFGPDHTLELTPALTGPTEVENRGIVGKEADLSLQHLKEQRFGAILMHLTRHVVMEKWRDARDMPKMHLFLQLKPIVNEWLKEHLVCKGQTFPAQLLHKSLADRAAERITAAITATMQGSNRIQVLIEPFNREGSTRHVSFNISRQETHWKTAANASHVNWAVCDSDWEAEFCRVVEKHSQVKAYVKNHNLGLEVPYMLGGQKRTYIPDFILLIEDGYPDPLHLIVEIKGYRGEDAKEKKNTMDTYWVPGVNNDGSFGLWAFAEFPDVWTLSSNLEQKIQEQLDESIGRVTAEGTATKAAD